MNRSAYLRVYVPAERFEGVLEHVSEGSASKGPILTDGEFGVSLESARDDAFFISFDGRSLVCPRYPRLRMLEGLLAFHNAYAGPTASVLIPEETAERAADELSRINSRFPAMRSHILTSPFYVPLRWFAAFDPDDRFLAEEGDALVVKYRTAISEASDRIRKAIGVLEEAGFDDLVVEQVRDLLEWLQTFPRESVLELDYAGVSALFPRGELILDDSASDVAASLEALAEGDFEEAGERYAAAAGRWAHAQALVYAN